MYKDRKIMAFIGARGGSKGLPGKNTMDCGGKPLIAWSIEAALKSKYVDEVYVSTDCENIAAVAKKFGAKVPLLRPAEIAGDTAAVEDAINHLMEHLKNEDKLEFDNFVLLQPTSPLRNEVHIDEAIEKYIDGPDCDHANLISVVEAPEKVNLLLDNKSGKVNFIFPRPKKGVRRQDFSKYYLPNGAMYLCPVKNFNSSFINDNTYFYLMGHEDSVDVDSLEDIKKASELLQKR